MRSAFLLHGKNTGKPSHSIFVAAHLKRREYIYYEWMPSNCRTIKVYDFIIPLY